MRLWGPHWKVRASHFLGVSCRNIQKFSSGSKPVPSGVEKELYDEAARLGLYE